MRPRSSSPWLVRRSTEFRLIEVDTSSISHLNNCAMVTFGPDLERQDNTGAISTHTVATGDDSIPQLYNRPQSIEETDKGGRLKVVLLVALVPLSAFILVVGGTLIMTRDSVYREDVRTFPRPPRTTTELPWWVK